MIKCGHSSSLTKKGRAAAVEPHDAHVGVAGIGVEFARKLRPGRVHDPAGDDVHLPALLRHRQRCLFDINQLAAEIGVLGPVAVRRIEVALWV